MDETFVQINREILKWEWYTELNTCKLFMHLLFRCNFKDAKWRGILVKRGQFITSLQSLSSETGLSIQSVRTSIKNLEKSLDLTRNQHGKYTHIELKTYEKYIGSNTGSTQDQHDANTQLTHSQHTGNTQLTTSNKEKKDNNKDKDNKEERRKIIPPKREWIEERIIEKEYKDIDGERFFHYWNDRHWMADHKKKDPKEKVKDWHARLGTWVSMNKRRTQTTTAPQKKFHGFAKQNEAEKNGYDIDSTLTFEEQEKVIYKAQNEVSGLTSRPKYIDVARYLKNLNK